MWILEQNSCTLFYKKIYKNKIVNIYLLFVASTLPCAILNKKTQRNRMNDHDDVIMPFPSM